MTTVTVSTNEDCEMIRISVEGAQVFEGNYWDFDRDVMVEILSLAGIACEEDTYEYEE